MPSDRETNVLNTYRYLRMGLVALAAMLLVSIVIQIGRHSCYQSSISAYFYTPSHAVFVAALAAIGTCLIIYQGDGTTEDVLLNFTGFAAYVVAFVPTSVDTSCAGSVGVDASVTRSSVTNAVPTLAGVAVVAVIIAAVVNRGTFRWSKWSAWARTWFVATTAMMLAGLGWLIVDVHTFVEHAHLVAAGSLFVSLGLVVVTNYYAHRKICEADAKQPTFASNPYAVLAASMVATGLVSIGGLSGAHGWHHRLFWIELAIIGEFMAFWAIESKLLWNDVTPTEKLEKVKANAAQAANAAGAAQGAAG